MELWKYAVIVTAPLSVITVNPSYAATVVDFNEFASDYTRSIGAPGGTQFGAFQSGEFTITSSSSNGSFAVWGNTPALDRRKQADPGFAAILNNSGGTSAIFSKTDQSLFNLISIDFADANSFNQIYDIRVEISTITGEISQIVTLANNGLRLQTFNFDIENVTSFRATAIYNGDYFGSRVFQFDNLTYDNVQAVPEPATWAFMIFGFGAIGGAMRRQRKAKANVKFSYA